MRGKNRQKRTDIQALRAIAVLAVVIYHLWPERLIGGFMGVDVFFVISGYLMTLTIMRDLDPVLAAKGKFRSTANFLVNFYARRIKRLIPAASVTLLGTLFLTYLTGNYVTIIETSKQIIASALFYQNWQLATNSVDYLAATDPPTAVQHFWTLSLEEQFYLVWPILLLIFFFLSVNLTLLYKRSQISGAVLPTILLVLFFFAYGYNLTQSDPAAAYFVTFARVWELLIGAVLAFLPKIKNYDLKLLLPWLGTAMIAYAMYRWGGNGFPGWRALFPTIGTALIIYAGTGKDESKFTFTNLLKAKPIQWIGDISYSLYLWHWPFIVLLPVLLGVDMETQRGAFLSMGILIISVLIAGLSYKFVELPAQKIGFKKRYIYMSFVFILVLVAGSAYLVQKSFENRSASELDSLHQKVAPDSDDKCVGAKWMVNKEFCDNGFGKLDATYAQFTSIDHYQKLSGEWICGMYDYRSKKNNDVSYTCEVGDVNADYQVTVFGDSHAGHFMSAFNEIGKRNSIRFIILDNRRCGAQEINKPHCLSRLQYLDESNILDESEYILLSNLHKSTSTRNRPLGNLDLTIETIQRITDTPFYLLEDTPPASKFIGRDCINFDNSCKRDKNGALMSIKTTTENAIRAELLREEQVIETSDFFCDETYCYSAIGGVNVYFNIGRGENIVTNSHLSSSFARSLALPLEKKLTDANLLPTQ